MATLKDPFNTNAEDPQQTGTPEIKLSNGRDFTIPLIDRKTGKQQYEYAFTSAADFAEQARTTFLHADTLHYDFSGMDLRGVDFSGCAGMEYARFDGCNLAGASFHGTKLEGASFRDCDLSKADLSTAEAEGADFTGSILKDASLRSTNATGANFFNADLGGAETHLLNLREAHLEFTKISEEQKQKAMFFEQATRMISGAALKRVSRGHPPKSKMRR